MPPCTSMFIGIDSINSSMGTNFRSLGLLLLTDDGALTNRLLQKRKQSQPSASAELEDEDEEGVSKEYHVDVVRGKGVRFMHGEPIDLAATLASMQQPLGYSRQVIGIQGKKGCGRVRKSGSLYKRTLPPAPSKG
jgi:hypothetical protein